MPSVTLPPPRVPPAAYDEDYYRRRCAGAEVWASSDGRELAGMYYGFLERAALRPGEVVVDVGTGRGELVAAAVKRGAARAYGIEYSPSAVKLAGKTIAVQAVADRAQVLLADARHVPLPDGIADLVCFLEVVEHLTAGELHAALLEARRLLKPHGRIVIYTMPNRLIYSFTYRALWTLAGWWRGWPRDPRNELERLMHVHEHTPRGLRRALARAGLDATVELGAWVYVDFVPSAWARRVYRLLARLGPLAMLGIADLWATARNPAQ
jgi:SAM-dependent methyltransferase